MVRALPRGVSSPDMALRAREHAPDPPRGIDVGVPRASLSPTRGAAALLWVGVAQLCACAVLAPARVPPSAQAPAHQQPQGAPPAPAASIVDPGPDFGFIPNSAQVVQPGRFYIETAFESTRPEDQTVRTNFVPVLLRVGVIEGLELRALMNVFSHDSGPTGDTTGHGPLQLGFKLRFNQGEHGLFNPSVGVEGEFLLPVASAGMDSGKVEPSGTLNVDHFLSSSTTLTWNIGVFAPVDETGEQFAQRFFGAALTQQVADRLQVYVTGEYRTPNSDAGGGSIGRVGTGLYGYLSRRIVFFGGYNWGLTSASLDTDLTLGLAFAF